MTIKTLNLIVATLLLITNLFADETLEPITIVSSNKTIQSIQNTTSNVTVITVEDIEENGYHTVAEAIEHKAGMIISQSGGMGQLTSVFTRGMNGGQTLILLDGMRLNDPSTPNGAAQLETLTTNNIEQIEIIKGGASSIWGSNASAGVINIITKNAQNGLHGSLDIGYGSHATKSVDTQLSYKNEKFTLLLQASKLKTDGISALAPSSAEEDGYENKSYNIKLGYNFNTNNKFVLSYNNIKTETEFDGFIADDEDSVGDSRQKNYTLDYTYKLDNYSAIFHASKSDIKRNYASISPYSTYNSLNKATSKEYSFINQYSYGNNKAILGFEYKDIDGLFESAFISSFGTTPALHDIGYKNKAIFLSNTYYINDSTLLETNLRYDNFNKFDNKTTYKIGLKHEHSFLEGFTTSTNYYTSYDAPSTYQLAKQSPTISSLKPMYTKGFDISAGYKDIFNITYFKNSVTDGFENIGMFPTIAYVNHNGRERFSGIELNGIYSFPTLNLNIAANYTRLLKYEGIDRKDLTRRPKETLNISLDKYIDNNTHWGVNAQYVGDRTDKDYVNGSFDISSGKMIYPSVSTGNYTLWNLNFSTKVMSDIDISIHAKNIFDKEYESVYGYATEGRSIYAKIKYSF